MDIVRLVVQFGVHEGAGGEAVAPEGRPDREKETGSIVPDMGVAVKVADVDCPCVTMRLPGVDTEKLKGFGLLTVTGTVVAVVWFPARSRATAVSM